MITIFSTFYSLHVHGFSNTRQKYHGYQITNTKVTRFAYTFESVAECFSLVNLFKTRNVVVIISNKNQSLLPHYRMTFSRLSTPAKTIQSVIV